MNLGSMEICLLCWIALTGLICGAMVLAEKRQHNKSQRKQKEYSPGESCELSKPSFSEGQFQAAYSDKIWPPAPQVTPPKIAPMSERTPYNPLWVIEDTFCFALTFLGSVFSWGMLALPILVVAVPTVFLTRTRRAKCAAKCAVWGAGIIALLIVAQMVQEYSAFGWTPW